MNDSTCLLRIISLIWNQFAQSELSHLFWLSGDDIAQNYPPKIQNSTATCKAQRHMCRYMYMYIDTMTSFWCLLECSHYSKHECGLVEPCRKDQCTLIQTLLILWSTTKSAAKNDGPRTVWRYCNMNPGPPSLNIRHPAMRILADDKHRLRVQV